MMKMLYSLGIWDGGVHLDDEDWVAHIVSTTVLNVVGQYLEKKNTSFAKKL